MRHARLEDGGVLYRAHHPRWAFLPLSGEGAAQAGGRFNRPGVPALYLSLEEATSAAEYRQDNDVADPYTLVAYVSHLPELVDLRQLDGTWDPLWHDWGCDWRALYVEGTEPPSWELGDMLIGAAEVGLLFPSLARPGGMNLVIFTDHLGPGQLIPYDPEGRLPIDQSSWR